MVQRVPANNESMQDMFKNIHLKYGHKSIRRRNGVNFLCLQVWVYAHLPENLYQVSKLREVLTKQSGYEIKQFCFFKKREPNCPSDCLFLFFIEIPPILPDNLDEVMEMLSMNVQESVNGIANNLGITIN